jgi:hypothetical protein
MGLLEVFLIHVENIDRVNDPVQTTGVFVKNRIPACFSFLIQ